MIKEMGGDLYRSWSAEQRRDEIGMLVEGYRSGLPVPILCMTAEAIAGSEALAREHLAALMTREERRAVVDKEAGTNDELRSLLSKFLL